MGSVAENSGTACTSIINVKKLWGGGEFDNIAHIHTV
jgi:hypothetical protein